NYYRKQGAKAIIAAPTIAKRFSINLEVYRHAEETFSFNWCLRYSDGVIGGGAPKSKAPGDKLRQERLSPQERRNETGSEKKTLKVFSPPTPPPQQEGR